MRLLILEFIFATYFSVMNRTILIHTVSRLYWFKLVCDNRNIPQACGKKNTINFEFDRKIKHEHLEAYHIVLLSCLIEELKLKGYMICIMASEDMKNFLLSDVNVKAYWGKKHLSHVDSPDIHRFNLWRINEQDKDSYATSVNRYFSNHFRGKDVSFIATALNELYYNVFDHAKANGNSFSYIHYDENKRRIYVAVCDFGIGVAKTLQDKYPDKYNDDKEALEAAIQVGVTSGSTLRNRGLGLDNICSSLEKTDSFRLISNKAFLYIYNNEVKTFNLKDLHFNGTLIYFDFCTDNFEDTEIMDSFSL